MDDARSRSEKNPVAGKPASPGVGTPFAGESSSSNAPVPPLDKLVNPDSSPAEVDSDATPWESDPDATLVDAAPIGDSEATLLDAGPIARPRTPVRRSSPHSSKFRTPGSDSVAVFQIGEVVAERYEILQLLGEGGMGAVYKAADRALDRFVALKVIRPEMASNPAILARFKQELLLSHQVTHRNVIRIYDLGESDGVMFITMEHIEGKDLRSLIREKTKFTPEEGVEVIQQVCQALDAAHSVGIIHRDLKPQNIMQDPSRIRRRRLLIPARR